MDNIRSLLHRNVLQTNLADFQIGLLDKIDKVGEANKWLMFESIRGGKTSYLLAAYAYEKAFLYPGIRVCIVGSSLNKSKTVMNFIEEFWKRSKIGSTAHDIEEQRMQIGESLVTGRVIGTGEKICGLRPHILIFPDFVSIPKDIFETVIAGFAVSEVRSLPQIIVMAQCDDVDIDLYDHYMKYRKIAVNQGCLLKVKREDFPDGWLKS